MRKNGFTLIELIGVIAIIALILIIITPLVISSVRSGTEKADSQAKESIEMAAKNYASDNKDLLPTNQNDQIRVSVSLLKSGGYLDNDVKMPSTNQDVSSACVYIKKTNNNGAERHVYSYTYSDSCN